jgi:hypothetical protein
MKLSPKLRAERHRSDARDSLSLAMKARHERALAMLIDTAIESRRQEAAARREADGQAGR